MPDVSQASSVGAATARGAPFPDSRPRVPHSQSTSSVRRVSPRVLGRRTNTPNTMHMGMPSLCAGCRSAMHTRTSMPARALLCTLCVAAKKSEPNLLRVRTSLHDTLTLWHSGLWLALWHSAGTVDTGSQQARPGVFKSLALLYWHKARVKQSRHRGQQPVQQSRASQQQQAAGLRAYAALAAASSLLAPG
jgi:hypothetical protein